MSRKDFEALRDELENARRRIAELEASNRKLEADMDEVRCGHHVAEREREDEARRSSETLRVITETVVDSIFCKDRNSRYTFVNHAMGKLFGRPAAELVGLAPRDLFDEESAAVVEAVDAPVFEGSVSNAIRELDIAGRRHTFHTIQVPIRDGDQITGICGIVRDVTELHEAQKALQKSEARFRSLIESSHEAMFSKDRQGRYRTLNLNAAIALGGTCIADIEGKTDYELFPEEQADTLREADERVRATKQEVEVEETLRYPDGTDRIHLSKRWPSFDEDGEVEFVNGLALDITEHRQAEVRRRELEARVQQVHKLESLGVLASGIAHDFNNLLVGITGNMDLALLHLDDDSPVRAFIDDALVASMRAGDLIGQMLAYAGRAKLRIEEVDINDLVREMTGLLSALVSSKTTIRFDLADELLLARGDPTQVRQIVMNLFTNAAQAIGSERGEITIASRAIACDAALLQEVRPDAVLPTGTYVRLQISDTGPGIDGATLKRIFDPFFTTKETGSGLGLSAVHGIVRSHAGAVKVESEVGVGTTFTILLPAAQTTTPARDTAREDQWRGNSTVLVVDDVDTVIKVTRRMLEQIGLTVLTARGGARAVEVFREHHAIIDCVLLDLKMPEMDGEETFAALRAISPDVRVILSSGYSEQEATQRLARSGLAGFIQKPYRVDRLRQQLRSVLGD